MKLWDPPMTRPHSVTWVPSRDLWVIWVRGAWLIQGEVFGSGFARSTYTLVALNTLRSLLVGSPVLTAGNGCCLRLKRCQAVWLTYPEEHSEPLNGLWKADIAVGGIVLPLLIAYTH